MTVYSPVACAAQRTLDGKAVTATYTATGDFPRPPSESVPLSNAAGGIPLADLPAATRSMFIEVAGSGRWEGISLVESKGAVDVLALPFQRECGLAGGVSPPLIGSDPGETLGLIDARHALVVGGFRASLPSVVDLGTGAVAQVSPGLRTPRTSASVTSFGPGALVAGGFSTETRMPVGLAEVYAPASGGGVGGFDSVVPLVFPRARHGAVELADGGTLLVGGTTDGTHASASLEYVGLGEHGALPTSTALKTHLATPRLAPTVFLLPTGKIFVGGGLDDAHEPIASVEWLDADLDHLKNTPSTLSPPLCWVSRVMAFAPLEGGAVLAVLGAPEGPTPPPGCSNVQVLRLDGAAEEAPALSPPPPAPALLFPGAESSPLLVAGGTARLYNPWAGVFFPPLVGGPGTSTPTSVALGADPGLALWIGEDALVHGLRFATRNAYSTDTETLLTSGTGTAEFAPDHLGSDGDAQFDGALELRNGASAFLTDATFADFSLSFTATGSLSLVLRDDATGRPPPIPPDGACLFIHGPTHVEVERRGSVVSIGTTGQTPRPCMVDLTATERVSIGFQGPEMGTASVASVTVRREGGSK